MHQKRQPVRRSKSKHLARAAKSTAIAVLVALMGVMGLYSSLEDYQQDRLRSVAIVHLAAMAPDDALEPYQKERIERALKSED